MIESDGSTDQNVSRVAERLKERIYAELAVIAVTLGLALSGSSTHLSAALSVLGASLGLWLATIAAEVQGHRFAYGYRMKAPELRRMLFVTSPLMTAAVGPLILVLFSAFGAFTLTAALYASVAVDTATMFVWGYTSGRRMNASVAMSVLSGLANLVIGGIVIVVKVAGGH
ncbi:hypothetical protein JNUCC0626_48055 [Lentzea sp. JNUCC 0626]|uniref:hypothetical protein n=1 Tax=Lentzea sp. JNUCC 0626 TaxID=3367513 RepID=UPI0037479E26